MYSKSVYIFLLILVIFLFYPQNLVFAHSGRTDSSGGHNCYVGSCAGTYHYHNSGSAYTPPAKTYTYVAPVCNKPDLSSSTGSPQFSEVNCKNNVTFTWTKGIGENQYSIALSKYAGADPGPKADTYSNSMVFKDVSPGKWYVNVKGGNSCGWSDTYYWDIEVPKIYPRINSFTSSKMRTTSSEDNGKYKLSFNTKCGSSYSISPEIGALSQTQISQGFVEVSPKKDTTYTLTVAGGGQTQTKKVTIVVPSPRPTPSPAIDNSVSDDTEIMSESLVRDAESNESSDDETPSFSRFLNRVKSWFF